ncbi:hypothetical protein RF073_12020, partial [Serratia marcescens]|uniref:hypothetical protein n=1 Tax=Serratia marcescens TaxID=615 RepID=UPI0028140C2C
PAEPGDRAGGAGGILNKKNAAINAAFFLCTENPQLGWGFRKAYSFEYAFKAPFDLLENLAVWQLQRFI